MRGCIVVFAMALSAPAQVPPGVPLRVMLERRAAIKHTGDPIQGRLVDPVYLFDRVALPAGTIVEGHIAEIGGIPPRKRIGALLSGNLTPPREARAQFDRLVFGDGSRVPLRTSLASGMAHPVLAGKPEKTDGAADRFAPAMRFFKAPGKLSQLKSALLDRFPYHRQAWPAGTLFVPVLQDAVAARPGVSGAAGAEAQEVRARLLTPLNSATARRGERVEAAVLRPVFSSDDRLLIPEGSRLVGTVVDAQPAGRLHRNGKLHIVFRQLELSQGTVQAIQGQLDGVEADAEAHLALDAEGVARASSPKTRFLLPALSVAVAGVSLHQDFNARGVPDQDMGGRAESGAVGLGLIGMAVAQASQTLGSSLAFAGAGYSIYTHFLARGQEVVLPANTPLEVSVETRAGQASGRRAR